MGYFSVSERNADDAGLSATGLEAEVNTGAVLAMGRERPCFPGDRQNPAVTSV